MTKRLVKVLATLAGIAGLAWAMRDRLFTVATSREPELPTFRSGPQVAAPSVDVVEGIGPVYAERLTRAGISDIGALAEASPDRVSESAGVGITRARAWIESAQQLR